MEEKNMRELSLEEMDKISGGIHDTEENRRDYYFYFYCPYCNAVLSSHRERLEHIKNSHPEQSD